MMDDQKECGQVPVSKYRFNSLRKLQNLRPDKNELINFADDK